MMRPDRAIREGDAVNADDLAGQPLFAGLSKHDLEKVARWADDIDVAEGYRLLDQGRLPHEFFLILEGTARVELQGRPIAEMGPGDFFGEIALVEDDRRTASVIASTPMRLVVMSTREFDSMRHDFPAVEGRIHDAVHARSPRHDLHHDHAGSDESPG
jgi:CRP-like cAMP-binding protein